MMEKVHATRSTGGPPLEPSRLRFSSLGRAVALLIAMVFAVGPIYWAVNTSLKRERSIVNYPPDWLPAQPTLSNYGAILTDLGLLRNGLNSILVAGSTILLVLAVAIPAGYAAARFAFTGREFLLFVLLMTVMLPGIVTLIPLYLFVVSLGLHDTYVALILVFAASETPIAIWVLRGFFLGIPPELDDAAMVDGCTRLQALRRVILPVAWPGVAAAAIVVFVFVWNELVISLTLTSSNDVRPATVGIFFFVTESGILWGRITAAAVVVLVPSLIVFFSLQRKFIAGLAAGASK